MFSVEKSETSSDVFYLSIQMRGNPKKTTEEENNVA